MVTTPRERRYLYQSIASILLSGCDAGGSPPPDRFDNSTPCSPLSVSIPSFTLNVLYTHAESHADFIALTKARIPHVNTFHLFNGSAQEPFDSNWWRRGLQDYVGALQLCQDNYAEDSTRRQGRHHFTLILEDDIVTTRHVIDKLVTAVQPLLKREDWLLLRLYRSSFWDGWEVRDWPVLIMYGIFGGVLGAVTAMLVDAIFCARPLPHELMSNSHCRPVINARACQVVVLALVAIVSGLITVAVLLLLNRQNIRLLNAPTGLSLDDSSAGAVALLFPTANLTGLLTFLRNPSMPSTTPIDNALNQYAEETGLEQLLLVPNLFDHRGVYSSAATKNKGSYKELKVSSTFYDEVDLQRPVWLDDLMD